VKTFLRPVPGETSNFRDDIILGLRWQTPETRCVHPHSIEFANDGANDA
jgi:hypothetical protein